MRQELLFSGKLAAALRAFERLEAAVKQLVPREALFGREFFVAIRIVALDSLHDEVGLLVAVAPEAAGELLAALRTQVRGDPDVTVAPVGVRPGESLVTHVALKRVDSGVDGLEVSLHCVLRAEGFLALRACPLSQVFGLGDRFEARRVGQKLKVEIRMVLLDVSVDFSEASLAVDNDVTASLANHLNVVVIDLVKVIPDLLQVI